MLVERKGNATVGARVSVFEDLEGTVELPSISNPATLAFDAAKGVVTAVDGTELVAVTTGELRSAQARGTRTSLGPAGVAGARGATYDPATGALFLLDGDSRTVLRTSAGAVSGVQVMPLEGAGSGRLQGLAFNQADGLLYVASPDEQLLYGVGGSGRVEKTYSLAQLGVRSLQAFVFAPSADPTDDPARQSLFIADASSGSTLGRVVEATLEPVSAAVQSVVVGTEVQRIQTSLFSPPSPDPAGIAYDAANDRLIVGDSEVDEMTIYQGKNLFTVTRQGSGVGTGTTLPTHSEPAGVGFDPATRVLYLADDDHDRVYMFNPGGDGIHGTPDDVKTFMSTSAFGSLDSEGVEFDPVSGHLFVADGVGKEVYRVDPVNGVFGDGNDAVTHFDVEQYGSRDAEGIGIDVARGVLLVMDPSTKSIFEVTKDGALVREIDCDGVGLAGARLFAGVTVAPTSNPSDSPSALNYWIVDRQVDNGSDPNENDGLLYEVSAPPADPPADSPPSVSITSPGEGATVSGTVTVVATASDDNGVTQVAFAVDGTPIGTDTNGADGWSVSWNTTTASDGPHTISATATDTIGQTGSDSNGVTVDNVPNVDTPPSVAISSPAAGAVVTGTISVQATASDDVGVTQVAFAVDGTSIGTDTNGADGWSMPWNTTTTTDGPHTVSATATDTIGQTGSDSRSVTVDNTAPTVTVTAPAAGSTLAGSVLVQASASDGSAVASVQFFANGSSLGIDTTAGDGWSVTWDTTTGADGAYDITARATDVVGLSTTSAPVGVTVDNPNVLTLEIPVATGPDDAVEYPNGGQGFAVGAVALSQGDLELGTDHGTPTVVGVRFTGVSVPVGAAIVRAYVQFEVDENGKSATLLSVRGQDSDSAATFTTAPFGISSRPTTSASVSWSVPRWQGVGTAGPAQQTPELKDVVQEIVDRPGWAQGNALAILVTGTGRRTAESFNGLTGPAILHVEYTLP